MFTVPAAQAAHEIALDIRTVNQIDGYSAAPNAVRFFKTRANRIERHTVRADLARGEVLDDAMRTPGRAAFIAAAEFAKRSVEAMNDVLIDAILNARIAAAEAEFFAASEDDDTDDQIDTADAVGSWGTSFDPYEIQWGFSVRTRP